MRGSGRRGSAFVAHMRSPRTPAVHMNTRMFWTPAAWWFGGGSDLNPAVEDAEDTAKPAFHAALEAACDAHDPGYYPRFKAWADEYFIDYRHRGEARGVGNFYDDLCTGDWEADFAFTRDVGRAFLAAFVPITERHMGEAWSEAEREVQLVKRGRYADCQPALRPGDPLRAGDGAQRRGGADVDAAGGEVALMRRVRPGEGKPGRAVGTRHGRGPVSRRTRGRT